MKVKIKSHPYFKREQFDIHTINYISITQAVLGGKIKLRTLYGEVTINVDPGTNDGDSKKLLNYVINKFNGFYFYCYFLFLFLGYYKTCPKSKSKRTSFH